MPVNTQRGSVLPIVILFVLAIIIPVVMVVTRQSQDIRKKAAELSDTPSILQIDLQYDKAAQTSIKITKAVTKPGNLPKQVTTAEGDYQLQALDKFGQVVLNQPFRIPNIVEDPSVLIHENTRGALVTLDTLSFSLVVAGDPRASKVRVVDKTQQEVYKAEITSETLNRASFRGGGGNDGQVLDILFIGQKYTSQQQLDEDVAKMRAHLLTYEPFSRHAQSIRFHQIETNTDLACGRYTPSIPRLLTCDLSKVTTFAQDSGLPYDIIGVIVNDSEYGGSGSFGYPGITVTYNGSDAAPMFVHELGHAFGDLADEYVLYSGTGYMDNSVYRGNCYAGAPPAQAWQNLVQSEDYYEGCTYANWYRSSQFSIMRDLNFHYFNPASVQKMTEVFSSLFSSPTPRPTPSPSGSLSADLNNDGVINIFDLSILLSHWNMSGSGADINQSGTVDVFDLNILLSRWSK